MTKVQEKKLKEIVKDGKPKSITIDGKKIYVSSKMITELKKHIDENYKTKKEGGVFPLLAAIPAIIAALGGASAVAGGVATAINQAKQAQKTDLEKEKLTEEIKQIKGKGLRLSPYEGRSIYDFIKMTKHTKLPFLKENSELEITHDGECIYIRRPP